MSICVKQTQFTQSQLSALSSGLRNSAFLKIPECVIFVTIGFFGAVPRNNCSFLTKDYILLFHCFDLTIFYKILESSTEFDPVISFYCKNYTKPARIFAAKFCSIWNIHFILIKESDKQFLFVFPRDFIHV